MTVDVEIARFFKQSLRKDIDPDVDIFAMGLVDSLFAMQLVLFVESTFSITVERTELDIDNFRSVNALAAFVTRKTAGTEDTQATC